MQTRILVATICVLAAIAIGVQLNPPVTKTPFATPSSPTIPYSKTPAPPEKKKRKPIIKRPSLIFISAKWCGPCQQAKPTVQLIEDGGIKVIRLNADEIEGRRALERYQMNGIPCFVIVDADGQEQAPTNDINSVYEYFKSYLETT